MNDKRRDALTEILGYLDAYECSFCGGEEPGQHTEGCPVLELRAMVTTPEELHELSKVPKSAKWVTMDNNGKVSWGY